MQLQILKIFFSNLAYVIKWKRLKNWKKKSAKIEDFENYVKIHGFTKEAYDERVNLFKIMK